MLALVDMAGLDLANMKTSQRLSPAKQLGKRIRAARGDMSQETLARIIGTKQPVVSRYERGVAVPSSAHLAGLIHILDLDPGDVYDLVHRHFEDLRKDTGGEAA